MILPHISPTDARLLIERGALLVDIRDAGEHAHEHIQGARNVPLGKLCNDSLGGGHTAIVFQCRSGTRTRLNAPLLFQAASADAFILDGGIEAWKSAGLPVIASQQQPVAFKRRAQIAAGSLALLGAILGYAVHPALYGISAVIGAGLLVSGVGGIRVPERILKITTRNKAST